MNNPSFDRAQLAYDRMEDLPDDTDERIEREYDKADLLRDLELGD